MTKWERWAHSAREAVVIAPKNICHSGYALISDGANRHGAIEWTIHRNDSEHRLHRMLSVYLAAPGISDDDSPEFEVRGYVLDEHGWCSRFIGETMVIKDEVQLVSIVASTLQLVEKLTENDLVEPKQTYYKI